MLEHTVKGDLATSTCVALAITRSVAVLVCRLHFVSLIVSLTSFLFCFLWRAILLLVRKRSVIAPLGTPLKPFSAIPSDKSGWYADTWFAGVVSCYVAILSYDKVRICALSHVTDDIVGRVLTAKAWILRWAFCVDAYLFGLDFRRF